MDNARDADQVRLLLPQHAPGCLTLITSRNDLDDLDGVHRERLDILAPANAVVLLQQRSGRVLPDPDAVAEIARLCGYLPLTLEPVGRLLARQSPRHVVAALRAAKAAGDHRFRHLPAIDRQVLAAFLVSYQALDPEQRLVLRWCAAHPGPDFDAVSIAALTGRPDYEISLRLDELHTRAMLTALPEGRYTFHDLFLDYTRAQEAREPGSPDQERREGHRRLLTVLRERVQAATTALTYRNASSGRAPAFSSPAEARTWLAAATGELVTAAKTALGSQAGTDTSLGLAVAWWLRLDDRLVQAADLYTRISDAAAKDGDPLGQADAQLGLGEVARMRGEYDKAVKAYNQALALYEEIGDRLGQANVFVGLARSAEAREQRSAACAHYAMAQKLYRTMGLIKGEQECKRARHRLACQ